MGPGIFGCEIDMLPLSTPFLDAISQFMRDILWTDANIKNRMLPPRAQVDLLHENKQQTGYPENPLGALTCESLSLQKHFLT